jgi:hypothetical protein
MGTREGLDLQPCTPRGSCQLVLSWKRLSGGLGMIQPRALVGPAGTHLCFPAELSSLSILCRVGRAPGCSTWRETALRRASEPSVQPECGGAASCPSMRPVGRKWGLLHLQNVALERRGHSESQVLAGQEAACATWSRLGTQPSGLC